RPQPLRHRTHQHRHPPCPRQALDLLSGARARVRREHDARQGVPLQLRPPAPPPLPASLPPPSPLPSLAPVVSPPLPVAASSSPPSSVISLRKAMSLS